MPFVPDTEWVKEMLPRDQWQKVDEDGQRWALVKNDKGQSEWIKQEAVGTYRFTDWGYESQDEEGNWVSYAQMPKDVSHLSDAQRERLIRELRGELKVNVRENDESGDEFKPLPETPPLEMWIFHETDITPELFITDEQLSDFLVYDFTEDLGRAFFFASRWKGSNEARRHLGYNVNDEIEDVANLNSVVLAYRTLVDEIKRLARLKKRTPDEKLPVDIARLNLLEISCFIGTKLGSSMAMWFYNEKSKRAVVDLCLGDDCMDHGMYSEEMMLRYIAREGAKRGATKLWVRTRRTESGRIWAAPYFPKLGLHAVPNEKQDEEAWSRLGEEDDSESAEADENEKVGGLKLWLTTRGLGQFLPQANAWCTEMGAADLFEVSDNKESLAEYLEPLGLTAKQKESLLMY